MPANDLLKQGSHHPYHEDDLLWQLEDNPDLPGCCLGELASYASTSLSLGADQSTSPSSLRSTACDSSSPLYGEGEGLMDDDEKTNQSSQDGSTCQACDKSLLGSRKTN